MKILGLNKTTLLDYPEHVAATVFTGGCNFRCPFCHNADLVINSMMPEAFTEEEIISFLKKRQGILEGVCVTGGEPTLQPDLKQFILKVKDLGYLVKLDTNGYRPDVLKELLQDGLLDYVAMDVKAHRAGYAKATGLKELITERVEESIEILKNCNIMYEFRTTVVKGIHRTEDFEEIGKWIAGSRVYYLQAFRGNENVLAVRDANDCAEKTGGFTSFSREEMEQMAELAGKYVERVEIRGME